MTRPKLGILSLCIVLTAMASYACTAQAVVRLSWIVVDKNGLEQEKLKAELVDETDSKDLTLLMHVIKMAIAITCTSSKLSGINLESNAMLTEGGRVRFEGCEAYGKGSLEEALKCKLHSAGTGTGIIETGQTKGQVVLHELSGGSSELLTRLEPREGSTFVVIQAEGCSLPESTAVNGKIYFKDGQGNAKKRLAKHLIEQGPLTELWIGEDTAEHLETSIDGSSWALLGGEHKGLSWAAERIEEKEVELITTGGTWLVVNKEEKVLENLKASLAAEKDSKDLSLLFKVAGIGLALTCGSIELIGANLESEGKLTEGSKAKFTGCEIYAKGTLEEPTECNVHTTGKEPGTLLTNSLKGRLIKHNPATGESELQARIEPTETQLMTLRTEGCLILPELTPISGTVYFKDCENRAEVLSAKHLVESSSLSSITVNGNAATIDGSTFIKLGGEHVGLLWDAMR